ncbi:MAG: tyrosine-protein phosphatase [Blastocatellia bacterium]
MKQYLFIQFAYKSALTIALACSLALAASAVPDNKQPLSDGATIDVDNFGKVNDHLYRGSQPDSRNYGQLAALGVKTILDLREDAKDGARAEAERAGLRYINLPLKDKQYPQADAASRFLEVVNNSANWPVYMHCAGGRHRTGAMGAVYRMTVDGWDIKQAYQEMKQYDFYTSRGHECFKDYVYNFYRDLQAGPQKARTSSASFQKQ